MKRRKEENSYSPSCNRFKMQKKKKREGKSQVINKQLLGIKLANSYQITKQQSSCIHVFKTDT